uniref:Uncharacterized protein n=1 Tax=Rhodosorus marinus TaxID=101924 RepID=A0A7S3EJM7_9RHOD
MNVQNVGISDLLYLTHVRGEPFTKSCGSDFVSVHLDKPISFYFLQTLLPYSFDHTVRQAASSAEVHNPIDVIIFSSVEENHISSLGMTKDAFRSVSSLLNPFYNTPQILHLLCVISVLKLVETEETGSSIEHEKRLKPISDEQQHSNLAAAVSVPGKVERNRRQGQTLRNSSQCS